MGQSLSNLCGLKPAEPKQWPQFEAKMKSEVRPCRAATLLHPYLATHPYLSTPSPQGLSDAAIAAFKHNFVTLASGANLMISEAPPPVRLGGWPAAGRPSAANTSVRLAAALAASAQCTCAAMCLPSTCGPCAHAGSPRLGPPRPGAALFASGSVRAYCSLTLRGGAAETACADCLPAAYLLTAY